MITLKLGAYTRKDLCTLFDCLQSALCALPECQEDKYGLSDCEHCPYRYPCTDLYETVAYLRSKIVNTPDETDTK